MWAIRAIILAAILLGSNIATGQHLRLPDEPPTVIQTMPPCVISSGSELTPVYATPPKPPAPADITIQVFASDAHADQIKKMKSVYKLLEKEGYTVGYHDMDEQLMLLDLAYPSHRNVDFSVPRHLIIEKDDKGKARRVRILYGTFRSEKFKEILGHPINVKPPSPPVVPTRTCETGWTVETALDAFARSPESPYLQLVALRMTADDPRQLRNVKNRIEEVTKVGIHSRPHPITGIERGYLSPLDDMPSIFNLVDKKRTIVQSPRLDLMIDDATLMPSKTPLLQPVLMPDPRTGQSRTIYVPAGQTIAPPPGATYTVVPNSAPPCVSSPTTEWISPQPVEPGPPRTFAVPIPSSTPAAPKEAVGIPTDPLVEGVIVLPDKPDATPPSLNPSEPDDSPAPTIPSPNGIPTEPLVPSEETIIHPSAGEIIIPAQATPYPAGTIAAPPVSSPVPCPAQGYATIQSCPPANAYSQDTSTFVYEAPVGQPVPFTNMSGFHNEPYRDLSDRPVPGKPVPVDELEVPRNDGSAWAALLAEPLPSKRPTISPLAMHVPADQYFAIFRSARAMQQTLNQADQFASKLLELRDVREQLLDAAKRFGTIDDEGRSIFDVIADNENFGEIVLTGTDLHLLEGSDLTLLFKVESKSAAEKIFADLTGQARHGRWLGSNVYALSNSLIALDRLITDATKDETKSIGTSGEYHQIRARLVSTEGEEAALFYLSQAAVDRMVSAPVMLTQRRRLLCANLMHTIRHAAILYKTQFGEYAPSIDRLVESGCLPPIANDTRWKCPCEGEIQLMEDGVTVVCSHHGELGRLRPCIEIPIELATPDEVVRYREFTDFNPGPDWYGSTFAARLITDDSQIRIETLLTPLSQPAGLYSLPGLAPLKSRPWHDGDSPRTPETIAMLSLQAETSDLLSMFFGQGTSSFPLLPFASSIPSDMPSLAEMNALSSFMTKGIETRIDMGIEDLRTSFGFSPPLEISEEMNPLLPLAGIYAAPILYPTHASIPVRDPEVVDRFLDWTDRRLVQRMRMIDKEDSRSLPIILNNLPDLIDSFYKTKLNDGRTTVRCIMFSYSGFRFRIFYARIEDRLVMSTRIDVIERMATAIEKFNIARAETADEETVSAGYHGHARVQLDFRNAWKILSGVELNRAEDRRKACLETLGRIEAARRFMGTDSDRLPPAMLDRAEQLFGIPLCCPCEGKYTLDTAGEACCSIHGSLDAPRQPTSLENLDPFSKYPSDVIRYPRRIDAILSFEKSATKGVVIIERPGDNRKPSMKRH